MIQISNPQLVFLLIIIILTQCGAIKHTCPQMCNCTTPSDLCTICYQYYFKRTFELNQSSIECDCVSGYVENYPPMEVCCNQNCTICYDKGCYACKTNWTIVYSEGWKICICKPNYYYNAQTKDCLCILHQSPNMINEYYQPSKFECYQCPQNCECNISGCYYCAESENRIIGISLYQIHTCYCKPSYIDVNGSCNKKNNDCIFPYVLIGKECKCNDPYYLDSQKNCVCKSIKNNTSYYLYKGSCYRCPRDCLCNQLGCYYCSTSAKRTIIENNCTCSVQNGIQIYIQIDNQCKCLSPYHSETCQCNSKNYPQLFYNDSQGKCFRCPKDCVCNKLGCISCNNNTNRYNNCSCISHLIQVDGYCTSCSSNFVFSNNNCICLNQSFPTIYYYDQDVRLCNLCPLDCICNSSGCNQCKPSTFRVIHQNSQKTNVCYCNSELYFHQNSLHICQCLAPYIFNTTSNQCECQLPYIIINTTCVCSSNLYPDKFYLYQFDICRICPDGCICTVMGCIKCNSNTGRAILLSQSNFFSICPCIPIQINQTTTGNCQTCLDTQYIWNDHCVDCHPTCQSCNQYGCTKCKDTTFLQNNLCVCTTNDTLNNISNQKGKCICTMGYFNNGNNVCLACSPKCKICDYNPQVQSMSICYQCNKNVFRIDSPIHHCPCIQYYVQAIAVQSYCCHWSCATCNLNGCLTCLPLTYRYLNSTNPNNITCSCLAGFIEFYSQTCTCPSQTYLYLNQCFPCPAYCKQCNIVHHLINCSCNQKFNRQSYLISYGYFSGSGFYDCICKKGYQPIPQYNDYCYPQYCAEYNTGGYCRKCQENRELNPQNNTCQCLDDYYQDIDLTCKKCISGCVYCISSQICEKCDSGYYLITDSINLKILCIIPDTFQTTFYQSVNGTTLYIYTQEGIKIQIIQNFTINLILITPGIKNSIIKFNETSFNFDANINVLIIRFDNPIQDIYGPFLIELKQTLQEIQNRSYIYQKSSLYEWKSLTYSKLFEGVIQALIVAIIVIAFILHLLGQKQNELMFFLQSIYFFAMNIDDDKMSVVPFINYFRIAAFRFSFEDSCSPFNFINIDWGTQIQYSQGNYQYFSVDNSLLRNAGLALFLGILNVTILIMGRIIYNKFYSNFQNLKFRDFVKKYQKTTYRFFEWIHKSTMYPILFFAWSTIILYKDQNNLVSRRIFFINFVLSIVIIVVYTLIIVYHMYDQISRLMKYEMVLEYVFDTLASIVIIWSPQSLLLLLIPVFLIRSLMQLLIQFILNRFINFKKSIVPSVLALVQFCVLITIYFQNLISTIIIINLFVVGTIVHRIYKICKDWASGKLKKTKNSDPIDKNQVIIFDCSENDIKQQQSQEIMKIQSQSELDNSKQIAVDATMIV